MPGALKASMFSTADSHSVLHFNAPALQTQLQRSEMFSLSMPPAGESMFRHS